MPRSKEEQKIAGSDSHSAGAVEKDPEQASEQEEPGTKKDLGDDLVADDVRQGF